MSIPDSPPGLGQEAAGQTPHILAILCPIYNEEAAIPLFVARILPVMRALEPGYRVRLVFLNNASTDDSLARIAGAKADWPETYVISMSRNAGYQASLECGLRHVEADIFVIIDVDCEDPPELISQFVATHERGFDIVYGERIERGPGRPGMGGKIDFIDQPPGAKDRR